MTEWVEVVDREYLSDFIPAGGGCVKFAVGSGGAAREACDSLESLALGHGFLFIELGAKDTRLNRSDQIFFDVAKNIDWDRFASQYVRSALERQGWSLVSSRDSGDSGDSGGLLDFSAMAATNDIEETAIRACLKDALMRLYQNYSMSQEFRLAMLQLCRAQVAGFEHSAEPVKRWLRGELTRISEVKNAKLFQKVGRQNARFMFQSLTHWLRLNGAPGLVVTINISRCLEQVKKADRDAGHYYSSSALTEVYEVLRQLIDGSSGLNGTMIAVFAPESFLSDERRGVDRYQALKMRIFDDVRNRGVQNFLAPLVRLWQEAA